MVIGHLAIMEFSKVTLLLVRIKNNVGLTILNVRICDPLCNKDARAFKTSLINKDANDLAKWLHAKTNLIQ